MTPEELLKTHDKAHGDLDVTFNLVEDEQGDVFWGYGHQDPAEFLAEMNRWAIHCGVVDSDHEMPDHQVDHLYAKINTDDDERWTIIPDEEYKVSHLMSSPPLVFPVTRVML